MPALAILIPFNSRVGQLRLLQFAVWTQANYAKSANRCDQSPGLRNAFTPVSAYFRIVKETML
jgi:hypothetical protein